MKQIDVTSCSEKERYKIEIIGLGNYIFAFCQLQKFCDKWEKKQINPTDGQLERGKKLLETSKKDLEKTEPEDFPPNFNIEEARKFLGKLEEKIQKWRVLRCKGNNNDNDNSADKKKLEELKTEFGELKLESKKSDKDNFPYELIISDGIIIILLVIIVIFFEKRVEKWIKSIKWLFLINHGVPKTFFRPVP